MAFFRIYVWLDPLLTRCVPASAWIVFTHRHVISPEISLYNARIVYQWNIELNSGSIRTKVDPTDAVYVTWTDKSMTGKWVTDVKFPLSGTFPAALAANIRVRRQFMF